MKEANSKRKKIKEMEQKVERLFTLKSFDPQLIYKKSDRFFKNKLRGYLETTRFAKNYVASEATKGYQIDFILREDQYKPIFLALELDKITRMTRGEDVGQKSWTKLADIRASIKVWIYLTAKKLDNAREDFKDTTERLLKFLKNRENIDKNHKARPGFGTFIALLVLNNKKYKPRKKLIAWEDNKKL